VESGCYFYPNETILMRWKYLPIWWR